MPRRRSEEPSPLSIAGRLESLIASSQRSGRGVLDSQQLAALTQEIGHPLTSSYIAQLRRGSRTNPTIDSLRALAAVFGVPVSYFFPVEAAPDDQPSSLLGGEAPRDSSAVKPVDVGGRPGTPVATSPLVTKLEELFDAERSPDGSSLSVQDVADRCQALGYDVTSCYLADLRSGVKGNPSIKTLEGIAAAFGVHVTYFFASPSNVDPEHDSAQADRAVDEAMKNEGVREIALRSSELDPAGRRLLAAMIRELSDVKITRHDPVPPPADDQHEE